MFLFQLLLSRMLGFFSTALGTYLSLSEMGYDMPQYSDVHGKHGLLIRWILGKTEVWGTPIWGWKIRCGLGMGP